MSAFTVKVDDKDVRSALSALVARVNNLGPALKEIGEDIVGDSKRRFETSTGPDGTPWAPNSWATIEAMLNKRGGYGKKGTLTKRGDALKGSKRPLIGELGDLRSEIAPHVVGNMLIISANPIYAAIQQFGGRKSKFPHLWGDIPARPFLPITPTGDLYPKDRENILATLNRYLAGN